MEEIWVPIKGYERIYEISSYGRVKSLPKTLQRGVCFYTSKEKIKVMDKNKQGYYRAILSNESINTRITLHRLVAMHFIPNPENKPVVNHKDGDKENNRIENLEWVTYSENSIHSFMTGLNPGLKGERSNVAKLKEKDILQIRSLKGVLRGNKIAKMFDISCAHVSKILRNESWSHI